MPPSGRRRPLRQARFRTPPALRLRAQDTQFSVVDVIHGRYTGAVDDFVLRRGDGVPAYNLAVVVDDAASGIDQVVRGDDLLSSAPRQAYLGSLLLHPSRPMRMSRLPSTSTASAWPRGRRSDVNRIGYAAGVCPHQRVIGSARGPGSGSAGSIRSLIAAPRPVDLPPVVRHTRAPRRKAHSSPRRKAHSSHGALALRERTH